MTNIAERARELQEHTADLPGLDVEEETPRPPLADLEPNEFAAPDVASIVPENAPPTAPADTRTPAEIMGPMPDNLRRVRPKPKPSFAPDALQELIDAGADPDEAAERLQEQIERWS